MKLLTCTNKKSGAWKCQLIGQTTRRFFLASDITMVASLNCITQNRKCPTSAKNEAPARISLAATSKKIYFAVDQLRKSPFLLKNVQTVSLTFYIVCGVVTDKTHSAVLFACKLLHHFIVWLCLRWPYKATSSKNFDLSKVLLLYSQTKKPAN